MPAPMTRADSLRLYWTGASFDGATAGDAAQSRGRFRSSRRIDGMQVEGSLSGVVIEFVSASNRAGTGTIVPVGATAVRWTPPGGVAGAVEEIAIGQTRLVEGGGAEGMHQYVIVRRIEANASGEPVSLVLSDSRDDVFSMGDVSAATAQVGEDDYRLVCIRNESSQIIREIRLWHETLGPSVISDVTPLEADGPGVIVTSQSMSSWPVSGYCQVRRADGTLREIVYYTTRSDAELAIAGAGRGLLGTEPSPGAEDDVIVPVSGVRIAREDPSAQPAGSFQEITPPHSAPVAVTWVAPITQSSALELGMLGPGQIVGVWIHRQIPPGAVANPSMPVRLHRSFETV